MIMRLDQIYKSMMVYTFYDSEIGLEMYEKVIYNIVQDDQITLYRMIKYKQTIKQKKNKKIKNKKSKNKKK